MTILEGTVRGWIAAGIGAVLWASVPAVAGEPPTVDTLRYRGEGVPGAVLGVPGASPLDLGTIHVHTAFHAERLPVVRQDEAGVEHPVLRDRLLGHLGAAVGVGRGCGVWAELPVVVYQWDEWPGETDLPEFGAGDLRLGATIPLLRLEKHPLGVAALPGVQLPTGMRGGLASSGLVEGHAMLGLEARPGPARVVATLGARLRPVALIDGVPARSAFAYGLGVEVRLHRRWTAGLSWAGEIAGGDGNQPMELRLGGIFEPGRGWQLGLVAAKGLYPGAGTPVVRVGFQVDLAIPTVRRAPSPVAAAGGPAPTIHACNPWTTVVPLQPPDGVVHTAELLVTTPVAFGVGETELSAAAQDALRPVAAWLRQHSDLGRVLVLGHGDEGGGIEYNALLSRRRAIATRAFLVAEAGLPPGQLQVPSSDPTQPPASSALVADLTSISLIVSESAQVP